MSMSHNHGPLIFSPNGTSIVSGLPPDLQSPSFTQQDLPVIKLLISWDMQSETFICLNLSTKMSGCILSKAFNIFTIAVKIWLIAVLSTVEHRSFIILNSAAKFCSYYSRIIFRQAQICIQIWHGLCSLINLKIPITICGVGIAVDSITRTFLNSPDKLCLTKNCSSFMLSLFKLYSVG